MSVVFLSFIGMEGRPIAGAVWFLFRTGHFLAVIEVYIRNFCVTLSLTLCVIPYFRCIKNICIMIKIYVMSTCPDCTAVKEQVKGNDKYEVIDIGEHVRNLKEFLRLRDNNRAFDVMKRVGSVGIPCFLLEDGTVTFRPVEAGLQPPVKEEQAPSCSIDGTGC